jgi:type I site-specific restriction endonuclease
VTDAHRDDDAVPRHAAAQTGLSLAYVDQLCEYTEATAKHLTDLLKATERRAKTIVPCIDQEHAADMRDVDAELHATIKQWEWEPQFARRVFPRRHNRICPKTCPKNLEVESFDSQL